MGASSPASILWVDDPDASTEALGGKVSSLAEMSAAGFDVPAAFGVTTSAFARFAEAADLARLVGETRASLDTSDHDAVETASRRIADVVERAPMPDGLEREIGEAYARLSRIAGVAEAPCAVRSSGVNEDLEGASFAGQYETYLWISGLDQVVLHVRRCWASLFNPAALTYRPGEGAPGDGDEGLPGMCVGVQIMVPARTAGVMFTLDPVSGDRSKIVIESCWGLGEGVVKGDVTPDRHRIDKVTLELLDQTVNEQSHEYRFDEDSGAVRRLAIDGDRGSVCSLTPDEVVPIAELGKRIERHRGAPQDIEWAIGSDGELHLLQARPETVWAARRAKAAAERKEPPRSATSRVISTFLEAGGVSGR